MPKILTLNLNYFADKHGPWEDRKLLIAEAIQLTQADIVAFQAVAADPEYSNGKNQALQLKELLPGFQYSVFVAASKQDNGRQEGNAVISKFPVLSAENILLTLLPATPDNVQRLVLKTSFVIDDKPFHLFNGHFSWVGEQTTSNVKDAFPFLQAEKDNALLVGDFNTDPKDQLLKPLLKAGWKDLWTETHHGQEGFTFESDKLFTRIDYALANATLFNRSLKVEIVQKEKDRKIRLSDHLGLLITL